MRGRCIRSGIYHAIRQYVEANNKCMKSYDKNKESSYRKHWDINDLIRWAMSPKLLLRYFILVDNRSKFDKYFKKKKKTI